ncbi:unnamed protein product [Eretmochelys imbricata]
MNLCGSQKTSLSSCEKKNILPTPDDFLPKVKGATIFSKLEASSTFCQIPLAKESAKLPTFITPFRRFCFQRFSFGITSAPAIFQKKKKKKMVGLLMNTSGGVVFMDNILIYGYSTEEHNKTHNKFLSLINQFQLRLKKKSAFSIYSKLSFWDKQ